MNIVVYWNLFTVANIFILNNTFVSGTAYTCFGYRDKKSFSEVKIYLYTEIYSNRFRN